MSGQEMRRANDKERRAHAGAEDAAVAATIPVTQTWADTDWLLK